MLKKDLKESWFARKWRIFKLRLILLKNVDKDYIHVRVFPRPNNTHELSFYCEGLTPEKSFALLYGAVKRELTSYYKGKVLSVGEIQDTFEDIELVKDPSHKDRYAKFHINSLCLVCSPKQYVLVKQFNKEGKLQQIKAKIYA